MVRERQLSGLDGLLVLAACGVLAALLSGCGMTTGWKVEFGVSPVTSRHDEQGLNTRELKNGSERNERNAAAFETLAR